MINITKFFGIFLRQDSGTKAAYWIKVFILFVIALSVFILELNNAAPGILHFQATSEFLYILDGRPYINKVFDPATLDWGLYRSRELMYLLYVAETYGTYYLGKWGFFSYFSISHYLFVGLIFVAIFFRKNNVINTRNYFYANALLLLNFYLTPNILLGGLTLYRPGKIALVFAFILLVLLLISAKEIRSNLNYFFIFMLSSMIGLIDEIGFVLLVLTLFLVACFLLLKPSTKLVWLTISVLMGILFHPLYNRIIGPEIISAVNRYQVSFSFQNENHLKNISYDAFHATMEIFFKELGSFYGGYNVYLGILVFLVLLFGFIWFDIKTFKRANAEAHLFNYLNPAKYYSVLMLIIFTSLIVTYTVLVSNFPSITSGTTYYMLPLSAVLFLTNLGFINIMLNYCPRLNISFSAVLLLSLAFNVNNALGYSALYFTSEAVQQMKTQTANLARCVKNLDHDIDSFGFDLSIYGPTYDYKKLCVFLRNKYAYDNNSLVKIELSANDQMHANELGKLQEELESYKAKYNTYPNSEGKWTAFNFCNKTDSSKFLAANFSTNISNVELFNKLKNCSLDYTYKSDGNSYKLIYDKVSDCGLTVFKYPMLKDVVRSCSKDSTVNLCYPSSAGYLADKKCWAYGYSSGDGKLW